MPQLLPSPHCRGARSARSSTAASLGNLSKLSFQFPPGLRGILETPSREQFAHNSTERRAPRPCAPCGRASSRSRPSPSPGQRLPPTEEEAEQEEAARQPQRPGAQPARAAPGPRGRVGLLQRVPHLRLRPAARTPRADQRLRPWSPSGFLPANPSWGRKSLRRKTAPAPRGGAGGGSLRESFGSSSEMGETRSPQGCRRRDALLALSARERGRPGSCHLSGTFQLGRPMKYFRASSRKTGPLLFRVASKGRP